MFNFAKFVEWPKSAFAAAEAPFVIGVLGQNPFGDDLARTIKDRSIDGHPLALKLVSSVPDSTNCHILFVSSSEKGRMGEIVETLKGSSVLTVGEMEDFNESGGMIRFILQGTKIRFRINKTAATENGLKISSKLLALALQS